ncbi:MFS transporter [Nonomuraea sp. SMC257]|uniref:MFS transporter n=1 Tax=Nonomuraea montanisoli TaxID=2741721 RepID=A0A7Y6M795_9ACTN|nr:MFS transporter [Nonomuraea montanisoli]NUW37773.1 MFS transporter [Nonomuraea montanisoli]
MSHHRAIAGVFAVHGAVAGSLATRIPWIQDHLALDPRMLGLALLCPPIGAVLGMPLAGRLAHRIGGRAATRLLLALWCAGLALPALSPAPAWLFAAFLAYGMAAGTCDVTMNAQAVVLERHLGRSIMSGLHGMWGVGSLAGGGAGTLAAQAGVDARLHLGGAALVLLVVGVATGRDLLPGDRPRAAAPGGDRASSGPRFALPSGVLVVMGIIGFCATFAEGASANWAAVYLTEVTGAGPGPAAAGYTTFMLCMAGTRLIGDRVVRRVGPVTAVRAGGVLAVAGGAVVVASRAPLAGVAGFAVMGVGVAVVMPLVIAAAGRTGTTPGAGIAGVASITYLSGLTAPAVTGWIAGAVSYPVAFTVITAVVVPVILLAPALREPSPNLREQAPAVREQAPVPAPGGETRAPEPGPGGQRPEIRSARRA